MKLYDTSRCKSYRWFHSALADGNVARTDIFNKKMLGKEAENSSDFDVGWPKILLWINKQPTHKLFSLFHKNVLIDYLELARKAADAVIPPILCSAAVFAKLLSPTRTTLPEAAVADVPPPPATTLPEAAIVDVPLPPLSVEHEVVHVPSKSPLRHPFFSSLTRL